MRTMMTATIRAATLPAIRPNLGQEIAYRRTLERLISQMSGDVEHIIRRAYLANEPEIAMDASPAKALQAIIAQLRRRWTDGFKRLAPEMAAYFATQQKDRVDATLTNALKRAGIAIDFKLNRQINDILQSVTAENVSLIKSIPEQYFTQIEGSVMRSVQTGIDLHTLTREIEAHDGVTRRRAVNIARDQTNKATAVINRARQLEVGFKQARWLHSAGGKTPRPSHVKAGRDGVIYDIAEGWFDPDAKVRCWPGTLINCRCVAIPIIPTMSEMVEPIAA
jgi:uncharacterized protein with gpF-like domain